MNTPSDNVIIGQILRTARRKAGISKLDLANRLTRAGVSDFDSIPAIEAVEAGEKPLTLVEAPIYAAACATNTDAIMRPQKTLQKLVDGIVNTQDLRESQNRVNTAMSKKRRALERIDNFVEDNRAISDGQLQKINAVRRAWESLTVSGGVVSARDIKLFKKGWEAADAAGQAGRRVEAGFRAIGFTIEGDNE